MALGLAVCRVPPSLGLCALLLCAASLLHHGISRFHDSSSVTADISLLASSFPPHLFIPVKLPPPPSLSQTLQSAPWYYLSLLERATHTIRCNSRRSAMEPNEWYNIIRDRCTIRTFLFSFSLLVSPSIFLSFNPGALGTL